MIFFAGLFFSYSYFSFPYHLNDRKRKELNLPYQLRQLTNHRTEGWCAFVSFSVCATSMPHPPTPPLRATAQHHAISKRGKEANKEKSKGRRKVRGRRKRSEALPIYWLDYLQVHFVIFEQSMECLKICNILTR